MESHILLQLAVRKPEPQTPSLPPEASYDPVSGVWAPEGADFFAGPVSKKMDLETGEDTKGE